MLGLAEEDPTLLDLFGEPRGPEPLREGEDVAAARLVPGLAAVGAVAARQRG